MKKHKGLKISLIVAIVCILGGFSLLGIGLAKGGSLRYLSVSNDTVSWWPWKHGNIGIWIGDDHDTLSEWDDDSDEYIRNETEYKQDLEKFSGIVIEANVGEVHITSGSKNQLRYHAKHEEAIQYEVKDGVLHIRMQHHGNHNENTIMYLSLTTDLLNILDVYNKAGNISIDGVRTKKLQIHTDAGNIDLEDIYSEQSNIKQECGNIEMEGSFMNKTTISNAVGNTEITLQGNVRDYFIQAANTLGNSEIFDKEYQGSMDTSVGDTEASNHILIENELGNLEVSIKD